MASIGTEAGEWKSPLKKLTRFFEKSRDQWKAKCQDVRKQVRLLRNQVWAVEKSREQWAERARQAEKCVAELEQLLAQKKVRTDGPGSE